MTPHEQHLLAWNDRLQDWVDGDLAGVEAAALEAHLEQCSICGARLEELTELDDALQAAAPDLSLDASFDERVYAQIDEFDELRRAELRRRMEQEQRQNLQELSRGWRRTLAFVIPGIIAGIALAFALGAWLDDSGLTRTIAALGAGQLGGSSDVIQLVLTTLLGAGLGLGIARWLANAAE